MFEQLKELLVTKFKVDGASVVPEATLDDTEIDSLTVVELSLHLEKVMHLQISDDEILNAADIGEIARLMEERGANVR